MRRSRAVTTVLALVAGIGVALLTRPLLQERIALARIADPRPARAAAGWRWLLEPAGTAGPPRAAGRLDRINDRLANAPDAALLEAGAALRPRGLWGWRTQPPALVAREALRLAASPAVSEAAAAVETADDAPLELDPRHLRPLLDRLVAHPAPAIRRAGFEAACAWAGPHRLALVEALALPPDDAALDRARRLTLAWADRPGPDRRPPTLDDDAALAGLAADAGAEPWRRRLALWWWDGDDGRLVRDVLALPPADPDGSVCAAALLAERRLDARAAGDLAATWIADLHDDRKRAGALLAAVLGVHGERLRRAHEREDVPAVRTIQRLALAVLDVPAGPGDPVELAWRALRRNGGDFDADVATCLLLLGHTDTLALLVSPPLPGDHASVRRRAWLVERFVPAWHAAAGRPPGADDRAVRLHFDWLRARWHLVRRRITFDPRTRTYAEALR